MKKNLILIIFFIFILSACAAHFHLDFLGKSKMEEVILVKSKKKEKILVLDLSGIIESISKSGILNKGGGVISQVYSRLKKASFDPWVKGVILRLDTPGGEGTASDIIYHEILMFKEKTGIPVVALMMGVAASGGYYVASACDFIIAHPTTITGSIGVIGVIPNFKEIMSKVGIKMNVIKSGKMKDSGSPYREMTTEEREYFQSLVDDFYQNFLQVIYQNRKNKLTREEIIKLADGRVYLAQKALKLKLIDDIGYFESALKKTLSLASLDDATVVAYSYYPLRKTNIYANPGSSENPLKLEIKNLNHLLPSLKPGFYYLWLPTLEQE